MTSSNENKKWKINEKNCARTRTLQTAAINDGKIIMNGK